ncbi:endonuclease domain-containing protein [Sphaerisporangium fuscum]|uniref:endonuclease domain-containing protein n=1 Tax=Sphaerisporangium fuscum TaxID=2835868 RepID=UPI001BDDC4FA|nr:DUF559 domain-containing protein [Sphaerisporangium fuscum]
MVATVLRELESAAMECFPAWLPGAEGVHHPGGGGVAAVRSLAVRMSSAGAHFGPFLADLSEAALTGRPRRPTRFGPEVRAAGLARVLAAASGRPGAALLVRVPAGFSPLEEEVLVAGCEWLAGHGDFAVWLAGAPLAYVDRVATIHVPGCPTENAPIAAGEQAPRPPIAYPPVAGEPHPGSRAEKALEAALAPLPWAWGRAWNQTYRPHPLATPIRVDLLWRDARCVVEIDGREHWRGGRQADDHLRDARLRADGFVVLRFTNTQVLDDVGAVVGVLEGFLRDRRFGTLERNG